eukprot:365773-Chlamydomonas_euryale.AAC.4
MPLSPHRQLLRAFPLEAPQAWPPGERLAGTLVASRGGGGRRSSAAREAAAERSAAREGARRRASLSRLVSPASRSLPSEVRATSGDRESRPLERDTELGVCPCHVFARARAHASHSGSQVVLHRFAKLLNSSAPASWDVLRRKCGTGVGASLGALLPGMPGWTPTPRAWERNPTL